ncbi:MAG: DUF3291 domain-containing protein [Gammaproteobacteria bacterium]|jgi:hypothetical protein
MVEHQLAQLNIARMKFPLEAPGMADFVARLDEINALADAAPGFVWRLQTEDGDATGIDDFGADILVNMSVWRDIESLREFAFRSAHRQVLTRRGEWFDSMSEAYAVLWWIPAGHIPTLEEARERLDSLRRDGPGPRAFTFRQSFGPA